jgi:hypothetical protein
MELSWWMGLQNVPEDSLLSRPLAGSEPVRCSSACRYARYIRRGRIVSISRGERSELAEQMRATIGLFDQSRGYMEMDNGEEIREVSNERGLWR